MAHQLTQAEIDAIDAAASEQAVQTTAEISATPLLGAETTLAYGAEGDCVQKLVELLNLLGYHNNSVIAGGPPILDQSVLNDVRAAQEDLAVKEPELTPPSEIPVGVEGEIVGPTTWNALYTAAQTKLNPPAPAPGGSSATP